MFTTYGSHNYIAYNGLLVRYDQAFETAGIQSTTKVKVTRHATKSYAFLNMTQSGAAACVAAKRTQYTRRFAAQTFDSEGVHTSTREECKTEIVSSVAVNGSRTVSISVNETDVVYANLPPGGGYLDNPASLFTEANARNYDENVMSSKTTSGLRVYSKNKNLSISQDLLVFYSADQVKGSPWTTYTRYATKRMAYVGMNQATAENCAKAKISQYTRLYGVVKSGDEYVPNNTRLACGASISLIHNGPLWNVSISVNETDAKCSVGDVTMAELFQQENGRSYEDSSDVELVSVALGWHEEGATEVDATATAACRVPDKTLNDCTFEYRVGDAVNWTVAQVAWSLGATGTLRLPVTESDIFCRLTCSSAESETIIAS